MVASTRRFEWNASRPLGYTVYGSKPVASTSTAAAPSRARPLRRPHMWTSRLPAIDTEQQAKWGRIAHSTSWAYARWRMLPLRPRLLALVVALLLLLPSTGFARVVHLCAAMGQVVSSCCCGPGSHRDRLSVPDDCAGHSTVERVPCCQADVDGTPPPPAGTVGHGPELPALALFDVAIAVHGVDRLATYHSIQPARCRAPPPVGRPLYIRHRALLS
jgi:hypothetical protein